MDAVEVNLKNVTRLLFLATYYIIISLCQIEMDYCVVIVLSGFSKKT